MSSIDIMILKNMTYNGNTVNAWYHNGDLVPVYYDITYCVDTGVSYTETVKHGLSIISPTTFTPSKSGWIFAGWRADKTATDTVLTTKNASGNTTLYAVFYQEITKTFISYDGTQNVSATRYYNNGNSTNASIIVPVGASYSGWTWRGWSAANTTTANASVAYANGATISDNTSSTYYGLYSGSVAVSYNANGGSGTVSSHSGTTYSNAFGTVLGATFTLKNNAFTYTSRTFQKWAMGSSSGTQYAAGASVTVTEDTTFYAIWKGTAVSNKTLDSGQGQMSKVGSFDTTGYSSVVISFTVNSPWAWMWLDDGKNISGTYDGVSETLTLTLKANSGVQYFTYACTPDNGYGGYDTNTSWTLKVTAS